MPRLFGTDGVRGVANRELTPELAFRLGRCGAIVLAGETDHRPRILVGSDTRISCGMLESALVAGICSAGADALVCGVIPTPGVAYLTRQHRCDAGVVISASHNSFEFNGIKFFSGDGFKLPDEQEDRIEAIMAIDNGEGADEPRVTGDRIGRREALPEAAREYAAYLMAEMAVGLRGLTIALDCANGAVSAIAPPLFQSLGARVVTMGAEPNGVNINDRCGSTHLAGLCDLVLSSGACLGFAFDGDGDRMLAVDERGVPVDGDQILSILALDMMEEGELRNDTLVVTVMSNLGLDLMAAERGLRLDKTRVGDRYVLEAMRAHGHVLGGEQSGHIILLDHGTTGDGLMSALRLLKALSRKKASLSEMASVMTVLPQVIRNARVPNSKKYAAMEDPDVRTACHEVEKSLAGQGRVLVRASGTEPTVRVMIEGPSRDGIAMMADELAALIERRCGDLSAPRAEEG